MLRFAEEQDIAETGRLKTMYSVNLFSCLFICFYYFYAAAAGEQPFLLFSLFYRWGLALKFIGQKLEILIATSFCLAVFVFHLHFFRTLLVCLHLGFLLALFFLSCSDVEINPGPERSLSLKLGHLNVRSLNVVDKFEEIASIILNEDFKIFALSGNVVKFVNPK